MYFLFAAKYLITVFFFFFFCFFVFFYYYYFKHADLFLYPL